MHAKTIQSHYDSVMRVLSKLKENSLKVNAKKLKFLAQEAKLLGVIINGNEKNTPGDKDTRVIGLHLAKNGM